MNSFMKARCGVWPDVRRRHLPHDRQLPAIYRVLAGEEREAIAQGELARDFRSAFVEAALFAADEPLTARHLAEVARLQDAGEARRVVKKLQGFYEADGTAFQVAELAGGYQLLTRPEYHHWLA